MNQYADAVLIAILASGTCEIRKKENLQYQTSSGAIHRELKTQTVKYISNRWQ